MQLVILAAGHGRRFGGLKQLAPVGPHEEALLDYTALDAMSSGFGPLILVVREEIRDEVEQHVRKHWPSALSWDVVCQQGIAGTAQAVLSARPLLDGPFGVANADDLYGIEALDLLRSRLDRGAADEGEDAPHVLAAYRLVDTIFTTDTVARGVCKVDPSDMLIDIVEMKVTAIGGDAAGYGAVPIDAEPGAARQPLSGEELVSMNLWGLQLRVLDHLAEAVEAFDPPPPPPDAVKPPELLLPEVVGDLVRNAKDRVLAARANGRCIGMTHPEDLDFVRRQIGNRRPGDALPAAAT